MAVVNSACQWYTETRKGVFHVEKPAEAISKEEEA